RQNRGDRYATPAGEKVVVEINDARGGKLREETVELNEFGSAWGSFELGADAALGECHARFRADPGKRIIGSATLFRIEEYKLPEFKVKIETARENGKPKAYLLGEKLEVEISAEYYFGGAVANGTIEAVV